jgi:hypothetical protein
MDSNGKGPRITSAGSGLPSRLIMHGTEGVGKSSFGAFAPRPIFAMTKGETGLLTLIDNGLVDQTPHFDECMTWLELLGHIEWLTKNQHDYRAFVIDTINGAERLCFEHVAKMFFGGDMLKFLDYGKGPDKAQQEWIQLLTALDRLRSAKKMAIITLCHTRVKTFKNPEGNDFDRYAADMHEKSWGLSAKWADIILFATFETFAKKDVGALKAKGYGGSRRLLYTQRTAAWDAKNRVGLPEQIVMQDGPDGGWNAFHAAVKKARALRPQQQPIQPESQPNNTPESNSDPVSVPTTSEVQS